MGWGAYKTNFPSGRGSVGMISISLHFGLKFKKIWHVFNEFIENSY